MRTILIVLFLLAGLALLALLSTCRQSKEEKRKKTVITVIADLTDPLLAQPETNPVLQLYALEQHPYDAADFRFKAIRNVQLVPIIMHQLPFASSAKSNGDPQQRSRNILQFYAQVRATLREFIATADTAKELANSECFYAIQQELTYLSQTKADRKIVLIFSDLFERSFIDVYGGRQLQAKDIAASLEKKYQLPKNLEGIEICFVFNPGADRVADQRYSTMVEAYRLLLQSRQAKLFVQASANTLLLN